MSSPTRIPPAQQWPFWLLGAWFVLSVVYLKVYLHSRSEFREAEHQVKAGELQVAIRHYGQTIRWYTPGNRYVSVAVKRLLRIGTHAFRRGDWEQAIISFQQLRNGLSSIRSFYQPHETALVQCQQQLAIVLSHLPAHSNARTNRREERQVLILKSLSVDQRPEVWVSCLIIFCYVLWLWLAARLCWGWGELSWRLRLLEGGAALGCFAGWLVGLSLA